MFWAREPGLKEWRRAVERQFFFSHPCPDVPSRVLSSDPKLLPLESCPAHDGLFNGLSFHGFKLLRSQIFGLLPSLPLMLLVFRDFCYCFGSRYFQGAGRVGDMPHFDYEWIIRRIEIWKVEFHRGLSNLINSHDVSRGACGLH